MVPTDEFRKALVPPGRGFVAQKTTTAGCDRVALSSASTGNLMQHGWGHGTARGSTKPLDRMEQPATARGITGQPKTNEGQRGTVRDSRENHRRAAGDRTEQRAWTSPLQSRDEPHFVVRGEPTLPEASY